MGFRVVPLLAAAFVAHLFFFLGAVPDRPARAPTPGHPVVVVDAGHGMHPAYQEYTGAYNHVADVYEDTFNLDLALRVAARLQARGAEVYLTRRDRYLPPDFDGDGHQTNGDRAAYALRLREHEPRASRPRADLYVSLHLNAHRYPSRRGTTVVYSSGGAARPWASASAELAWAIYEQLARVIPSSAPPFTLNGLYFDKLALPHAAVEVVFLTNPRDLTWIRKEENRDLAADLIATGIAAWWARQQGR